MSADFLLPDEAATEALARKAARGVHSATEPLVLYLQGELGSGKTCFARGMLRELGENGTVRSPTYGLLSEYLTPHGRVVHIDLYRLRSPQEIQALGLADHLAGSVLWLIEWPEKSAGAGLPAADVHVSIDVMPKGRRIGCVAESAAGRLWLSNLCADSR